MKKVINKIKIFLGIIISLFLFLSLFACKKGVNKDILREKTKQIEKIYNDRSKPEDGTLLDQDIIPFKYYKYKGISLSDENDIEEKLEKINQVLLNRDAKQDEVDKALMWADELLEFLAEAKKEMIGTILTEEEKKLLELFDIKDIKKYPKDWQDYLFVYLNKKVDELNKSFDFSYDYPDIKDDILYLISYMDHELAGSASCDFQKDFQKDPNNPFKSTKPVFAELPNLNVEEEILHDGSSKILKEVVAKDATGKDVSSLAYFIQRPNYKKTGSGVLQIAVKDNYGNTTIAPGFYSYIIKGDTKKPQIEVPTPFEITSLSNVKAKDLRTGVIATSSKGVRLSNDNIKIKYIFNDKGDKVSPLAFKRDITQSGVSDLFSYTDFSSLDELELSNQIKYLNIKNKAISLPTIKEEIIKWEYSSKLIEISDNKIKLLKYPTSDEEITITAIDNGSKKEFKIKLLSLIKEDYISLDKIGTYFIGYQAFDEFNNFSDIVEKKMTILPPSKLTRTNTKEITNIKKEMPLLKITDLEKIDSFLKNETFNLFYKSTYPICKRTKIEKDTINNNANLILFDEAYQYSRDKNKLDGFHIMTYDLMTYLDYFVPLNEKTNLVIPDKKLTNMMHKNGVSVLGYINVDYPHKGGSLEDLYHLIKKDENGKYKNIKNLITLAKETGIDGYVISVKTPLYQVENEEQLSQKRLEEYQKVKSDSKKIVKEEIIPFFEMFFKGLKNENLLAGYELGINEKGLIGNANIYSNDYLSFVKYADIVITGTDNETAYLKSSNEKEIKNFKEDTKKDLKDFYKGIFAGYRKPGFTIDNLTSLLDNDNKLTSSLAIFNLSNYTFNYKISGFNYNNLDPSDKENIYNSNSYNRYFDKISNLLTNNLEFPSDKKSFGEDFTLPSIISLKTPICGSFFKTIFNKANGYYYFDKGSIINDYRDNKTWNKSGGTNNLEIQSILPNLVNDYVIKPGYEKLSTSYDFECAYLGTSSFKVWGSLEKDIPQIINLFKTDLLFSKSPTLKLFVKVNDVNSNYYIVIKDNSGNKKDYKLDLENTTTWQEVSLQIDDKEIKEIGFKFEELNDDKKDISFNIGLMEISNQEITKPEEKLEDIKILDLGFKYNILADAKIEFNKHNDDLLYEVYQEMDGALRYLSSSYENVIFVSGIKRNVTNPNNPKYPTLSEYDTNFKLVILAKDNKNKLVAKGEIEEIWPAELIAGGKAELKISSNIATPGEVIYIRPKLSPLTESYEISFSGSHKKYTLPNGDIALMFDEVGFYDLTYITKNPYGTDKLELKENFIISWDVPSESDLTPDAFIDDSDDAKGIKYSDFVNSAEKPRYLIDGDKTGTKWCDNNKAPRGRWVIIEFNDIVTINRFVLTHCAASTSSGWDRGSTGFNTREYEIHISVDGENWKKVVHRENNKDTYTYDKLDEPQRAKYIKFVVINGGDDMTARVYDFRIYGTR